MAEGGCESNPKLGFSFIKRERHPIPFKVARGKSICQGPDGSICRTQPTVAMWLVSGQAGSKFTLFSRSSTTSWTTDGEYMFGAEFFLHSLRRRLGGPRPCIGCLEPRFHFL